MCLNRVPLPLPGSHFLGNETLAIHPPVQALTVHNADLRLGHVQPTTMLGRVMPLDLVQQATGKLGRERLVQAGPIMGVEVVLHQADLFGLWIVHLYQLPHAVGIVLSGASLAHPDVPPTPQRLAQHQLIADSLAFVLVVLLGRTAWPSRQRFSSFAEELLAGLIEADHRVGRVVRQKVGLDHVFHPPDVLGIDLGRDAPSFNDPGLKVVFLRAFRTVSVLTASIRPNTTISSAAVARSSGSGPRADRCKPVGSVSAPSRP